MKKKICLLMITAALACVISIPQAIAASNPPDSAGQKQINLTDTQKKEMKQLFDKKFEIEKQILQKYREYGVITKEEADMRLHKIENRSSKMEENGYIPKHKKYDRHRESEPKQENN